MRFATTYETDVEPFLNEIEGWAKQGLDMGQIASNLGIGRTTLFSYRKEHEELLERLKRGKSHADIQVENALFKRALGYEYEEEKLDWEGNILVKRTLTRKQVAPDPTSCIFWLKNRRSDIWRDRPNENNGEALRLLDGILTALDKTMQTDTPLLNEAPEETSEGDND